MALIQVVNYSSLPRLVVASSQTNPDRVGVEKKLAGQLSAASLAAEVNGCHF